MHVIISNVNRRHCTLLDFHSTNGHISTGLYATREFPQCHLIKTVGFFQALPDATTLLTKPINTSMDLKSGQYTLNSTKANS